MKQVSEGDLLANLTPRALGPANLWTEPRICGRARVHAACKTAGRADQSRLPRLEAARRRGLQPTQSHGQHPGGVREVRRLNDDRA
eukprot:3044746-Prymnesium_polylepis.1